jgi:uncharacterized protein (DUF983 family)
MFSKGSKLYSIFRFKCPRCQSGDFFVSHPYDLSRIGDIHEHCNECELKYAKEPGFYYGAMYVAYGLGVALFVALWASFYLFFPSVTVGFQIVVIVLLTIVLSPLFYALSKIIWANMFMSYDPEASRANKDTNQKANED